VFHRHTSICLANQARANSPVLASVQADRKCALAEEKFEEVESLRESRRRDVVEHQNRRIRLAQLHQTQVEELDVLESSADIGVSCSCSAYSLASVVTLACRLLHPRPEVGSLTPQYHLAKQPSPARRMLPQKQKYAHPLPLKRRKLETISGAYS
jgi:hypothetical protein